MSSESPQHDAGAAAIDLRRDDPGFSVIEAEATFAMSELFEVRIVVQHRDPDIAMRSLLRRSVTLHCYEEAFVKRIEGIIRRGRVVSVEPDGISRYELLLVPPLWLLTKRRNYRIFRDSTVPQIVHTILADHPDALAKRGGRVDHSHAERDYKVQ